MTYKMWKYDWAAENICRFGCEEETVIIAYFSERYDDDFKEANGIIAESEVAREKQWVPPFQPHSAHTTTSHSPHRNRNSKGIYPLILFCSTTLSRTQKPSNQLSNHCAFHH